MVKKRYYIILLMSAMLATGCGKTEAVENNKPTDITVAPPDEEELIAREKDDTASITSTDEDGFQYFFLSRRDANDAYLRQEEYFAGFSQSDIAYRSQKKDGHLIDVTEWGASQRLEFSEEEKEGITKTLEEMKADLAAGGYVLPEMDYICLAKSTQEEECGSGAYTHGTTIFLGQPLTDYICSDNERAHEYGKSILWHELFHCLTRNNPDFRKDMYAIIHFSVQEEDFELPSSVFEKYISNPDVEHHNSYATFLINGEEIDCFTALIAQEPFENPGDSFFDSMTTALVPIDGTDTYYLPEETENFWDIFGENTGYVIDPEECLADNFSYALTYGMEKDYPNPEIIEAILDYMKVGD